MVLQPHVLGMRMFIFSLFRLLKDGNVETCTCVEEQMREGLASYLFKRYEATFLDCSFASPDLESIDEYFRSTWTCCAEGNELRKYDCKENEGLWLVLSLILNDAKF